MHPYSELPDQRFWKRFVTNTGWRNLQLGGTPRFHISSTDLVATAGSCFAQHIARHMNMVGRSTYIAETPHPLVQQFGGETDSYTIFSARYGNVYTARQCLDMFNQAFGLVPIIEDFVEHDGAVYDLLRPNAIPGGFPGYREASADRRYHLACVKNMFLRANVFIFTLGLTESWYNAASGHTYPVCPGTARGQFDPDQHRFRNFTHAEIVEDMDDLISALHKVNPRLKIILTVSPVPLVATYTDNNVLVASSYSKSVLRAVCGEIESRCADVQYFPSYEIVGHVASFGQYLAADLREISERGVAHVMDCFFTTFFSTAAEPAQAATSASTTVPTYNPAAFNAECDELFNEVRQSPT